MVLLSSQGSQAEVSELNVAGGGEQDVLRLEVPVDDLELRVEVLESEHDFGGHEGHDRLGKSLGLLEDLEKFAALDVFHDEVEVSRSLKCIFQINDEGVLARLQNCFFDHGVFPQACFDNDSLVHRLHGVYSEVVLLLNLVDFPKRPLVPIIHGESTFPTVPSITKSSRLTLRFWSTCCVA